MYRVLVEVNWSDEALEHLARSQRYSSAVDIEADWTVEAVNDSDAVQVDSYWTSRVNALADRDLDGELHGMTAWPATGPALRLYTEGRSS